MHIPITVLQSESMMKEKIDYIHHNPVKRGYVEEAAHWRYSSAKDYMGIECLLEVERVWRCMSPIEVQQLELLNE